MQTIHLEPNQVPQALRRSYSGKKFKAKVCEQVTIPADAGLWSGGTRSTYRYVRLTDGETVPVPGQDAAPWDNRKEHTVTLSPGYAVVEHSIFCGADMGLTFYVHPDNAAAMLPAPDTELTPLERFVLTATRSLKSSYGGRDRYQMACDDYDCLRALSPERAERAPSRATWDATKEMLIARGYLNKAGAITTKGRNAVS
jgi:hypothetical protein